MCEAPEPYLEQATDAGLLGTDLGEETMGKRGHFPWETVGSLLEVFLE